MNAIADKGLKAAQHTSKSVSQAINRRRSGPRRFLGFLRRRPLIAGLSILALSGLTVRARYRLPLLAQKIRTTRQERQIQKETAKTEAAQAKPAAPATPSPAAPLTAESYPADGHAAPAVPAGERVETNAT